MGRGLGQIDDDVSVLDLEQVERIEHGIEPNGAVDEFDPDEEEKAVEKISKGLVPRAKESGLTSKRVGLAMPTESKPIPKTGKRINIKTLM